MMDMKSNWKDIRRLFARSFRSSLHFAMASITSEGLPHVTPIGSLILCEPGRGVYFEEFTRHMRSNFEENQNVCVLAVRSGLLFWLASLVRGRFSTPPAIRLSGKVGMRRAATDEELKLWNKRVGKLRFTKGYRLMWANMCTVRDVHFSNVDEVHLGEMTRRCSASFRNKNVEHSGATS